MVYAIIPFDSSFLQIFTQSQLHLHTADYGTSDHSLIRSQLQTHPVPENLYSRHLHHQPRGALACQEEYTDKCWMAFSRLRSSSDG